MRFLDDAHDPHDVAGLLKFYLRTIPIPLVPFSMYDAFVAVSTSPSDYKDNLMRAVIETLPITSQFIWSFLFFHLHKVRFYFLRN